MKKKNTPRKEGCCRPDDSQTALRLYPWQEKCLKSWEKNGFRGIVNVITGAGKTVLALAASAHLKNVLEKSSSPAALRTKIIVPSVPLAVQWNHELKRILPALGIREPKCGLYYSGHKTDPEQDYMIYVLNSARHAAARHILSDMQQGFHVLLIVDECHRCGSPENRKIFDFIHPEGSLGLYFSEELYHSLGLSATPWGTDGDAVLKTALGKEIYRYHFAAALRDGYVSRFSIFHIGLSFSAQELRSYMDLSDKMSSAYRQLIQNYPYLTQLERGPLFAALQKIAVQDGEDSLAASYLNLSYKRKTVSCMAVSRIFCTLSLMEQIAPDTRVIIFGERIEQAENVFLALSSRFPGRVGRFHSQMSPQARKNTLEAYRSGSLRILVSCRGLDEGIDVPDASAGIVLSGSSVNRQRIQRLGRILRRSEGKSSACLYYLYIRESSEDGIYLSEPDSSFPVCDLSYSAPDRIFSHPTYENLAVKLLEEGKIRGLAEDQMLELRSCLLEGLVRSDWLESPKTCSDMISSSQGQHEKNYWICMKRLALFRLE